MNVVISDTDEYGNYVFTNAALPLLRKLLMQKITDEHIGGGLSDQSTGVDNKKRVLVNKAIRAHGVESVGEKLRGYMIDMKAIVETA
mgnify:CR=1 FL=1